MDRPTKAKAARPSSRRLKNEGLLTHLLVLAVQANEQMGQLALLMDTRSSLDDALATPAEQGVLDTASPVVQRAVLKHTLNGEMRRQLRVLSHTVDALYDCADQLTSPVS